MKKTILFVLIGLITGLLIGFTIGFLRGETVYIWVFTPFNDELAVFWSAIVGVGTIFLAIVALVQNNISKKTAEKANEAAAEANNIGRRLAQLELTRDIIEKLVVIDVKDIKDNIPSNHTYLKNKLDDVDRKHSSQIDYWNVSIENSSPNVLSIIQIVCDGELLFESELSVLPGKASNFTILFMGLIQDTPGKEMNVIFNGLYNVKSFAKCKVNRDTQHSKCMSTEYYHFKGYKEGNYNG